MKYWITLAALALLLTGCKTISDTRGGYHEPPVTQVDAQLNQARKYGDNILKAFQTANFQLLKDNSPGDLLEKLTEKDFQTSCRNFTEKFGQVKKFTYLTNLETPALGNQVWLVTFERTGAQGNKIEQQLLFRLVSMRVDDKVQVVSYGFI